MTFKQFKEKYQKENVAHLPHLVPPNPLVSILVQTYNHEAYITECLDGILNQQTDFNFEILLGEDASTDKTRELCIDYAEKYPEKIRVFLHHPNNKIKVMNITTGNFNAFYNFYNARGQYIAFCEGDDYWADPLKLQKQVDFLRENLDFVLSYHRFIEKFEASTDKKKQILLEQPTKNLNQTELSALIYHPLLSTACFRNRISELPEEMIQVINVDSFLLSLLGNSGKGKFQPEIEASVYRRHSGGIWTKKQKEVKLLTKILTYQKIIEYNIQLENIELVRHFRYKIKKILKMQLSYLIKTRKFRSILKTLIKYYKT
jgi:glycosyltransferase involved in cell wall biosynthesis